MNLHRWKDIPEEALNETLLRQVVHTGRLTIARLRLKKGCIVPRHAHANEQFSTVESGKLRFFMDSAVIDVGANESLEIPPHAAHQVEALEDTVVLDIFTPPREDWIRGDDAYLRR